MTRRIGSAVLSALAVTAATAQLPQPDIAALLQRIEEQEQRIRFIERGFPTGLVPNRDLGLTFGGDVGGGVFNYSIGYFNGVTDGGSSEGNPTPDVESDTVGDWAARVFFQRCRRT